MTGADESHATTQFSFVPQAPNTLPGKFIDPMGVQQSDWTIDNYVDVNPAPGQAQDFLGGPYTVDGNNAMDFALANFGQMDAGYPVVAALGGTVVAVQDGAFDRNTVMGNLPGNFVVIDNGNGWQTRYSDFMANSIAVAQGASVAPGQVLGLIGSSGSSNNPELAFEVTHNGDVVETNYAAAAYWASPLPYEDNVPDYVLAAGISSYNPAGDLEEGPVANSIFTTSGTPQVWYWYRLSHLDPGDEVNINWYPSQRHPRLEPEPVHRRAPRIDAFSEWSLGSNVWGGLKGSWQVQLQVNGQVINSSSFTVTSGSGVPDLRVTQGNGGTYIPNNRTTPISFGSVPVGLASPLFTFTLQNIGRAQLNLSNLVLPPSFLLMGSFPTAILAGSSATFTVGMSTSVVGPQFGQLSFSTDVPSEATFGFNIAGTVTGTIPSAAPTVTLPSPAAVYDPRFGAVAVDPAAALTDGFPQSFDTGTLTVDFASGGTVTAITWRSPARGAAAQISTSGNMVLYGGTVVGTFAGGNNLAPLIITFNAASTLAAVQAVARDVTFRTDAPLGLGPRYVAMSLVDSLGDGSTTAVKTVEVDPDLVVPNTQLSLSSNLVNLVYGQSVTVSRECQQPHDGSGPDRHGDVRGRRLCSGRW